MRRRSLFIALALVTGACGGRGADWPERTGAGERSGAAAAPSSAGDPVTGADPATTNAGPATTNATPAPTVPPSSAEPGTTAVAVAGEEPPAGDAPVPPVELGHAGATMAPPAPPSPPTTAPTRTTLGDAFLDTQNVMWNCATALPDCSVEEFTVPGSQAAQHFASIFDEWVHEGLVLVRSPYVTRAGVMEIELGDDGRSGTVTACVVDGDVLIDPGAGPGGVDVFVDDAVVTVKVAVGLLLTDAGWRRSTYEVLTRNPGEWPCED